MHGPQPIPVPFSVPAGTLENIQITKKWLQPETISMRQCSDIQIPEKGRTSRRNLHWHKLCFLFELLLNFDNFGEVYFSYDFVLREIK